MRAARQPRRARRPRLPVAPAATQSQPRRRLPDGLVRCLRPPAPVRKLAVPTWSARGPIHTGAGCAGFLTFGPSTGGELTDRKGTSVSISSMRLTQRRVVALLGGAGLVVGVAAAIPGSVAAAPAPKVQTSTYIVQMSDLPAAGYTGKVPGYSATKPANGAKLNARSADAVRYRGYLQARHDAVISSLGNIAKVRSE